MLAALGIASIAYVLLALFVEGWQLAHGRKTISEAIWEAYRVFPFLGVIVGLVVGALAAHFFWT